MYIPAPYAESRTEELQRMIREHSLGMLVTHGPAGLDANHIPFLLDTSAETGPRLLAHVARANPVWQMGPAGPGGTDGTEVMVVFRGPSAYISPNWYPGKHETHRRVPTWNYEVVHAHGRMRMRDDEKFVRGVIARLTRQHEASQPEPWKMGDAPPDYIAELMAHIVGIEIQVERLEGKRKLNQHHSAEDLQGAIEGLEASGSAALAQAMKAAAGS
jgi:transcriptional regulator